MTDVVLRARGLARTFHTGRAGRGRDRLGPARAVVALDGVDLDVRAGRTLALVGESGSGKTTLARALLRLVELDRGAVVHRAVDGRERELGRLSARELRALRPELQIVFQDPTASLNPRFPVRELLGEAPRVHGLARGAELERRLAEALERVGLDVGALDRYPHAFSAGQRQRIAIARALVLRPRVLVCDEPTSALDVSVQAQVLNLLADLRDEEGIALVLVAHDLALVRAVADEVAVLEAGRVVERGTAERVLARPDHPATRRLVEAVLPLPGAEA